MKQTAKSNLKLQWQIPMFVIIVMHTAYILVKGTLTITGIATDEERRQADERNKG